LLDRRAQHVDAETQTLLRHIDASAAAAERVVEGLRRYTDATGKPFEPRPCDLTVPLNSALARLHQAVVQTGATVAREPLPTTSADLVQVTMLFEELIGNSLRFRSDRAPAICISAKPDGPAAWLVAITDNGIGLDEVAVDRIFQPFVKCSPAAGAGIGLTICRHIANTHGWRIEAFARPVGSEFRVSIPRS